MRENVKEEIAASGVEQQVVEPSYSRFQVISTMVVLLLALFFSSLDQNIVGTAMPRIIGEFRGFDRFTWVATAFMLAATVTIPIYGKLSDLFGRKIIFVICMSIFLLGSALCGMAQSMDQLIIFRAFQGLGAGGIMPVAMVAFADLLTPKERAKWQGMMMGIFTFASILGPVIGGWITDHTSWRWVFYVNLPIDTLALLALLVLMPTLRHSQEKPHIDFVGATLLIVGVVPVLLGFSWAGSLYPWLSWQILGLLCGGVLVLIILGFYEVSLRHCGGEPVIDPSLFKNRVFSISTLGMMIMFMSLIGSMSFLPLYVQGVLHVSATESGFLLTPMMLGMVIGSVISGQIASRTGQHRLIVIIGMGMLAAGAALLLRLGISSSYIEMISSLVLMGLGAGACLALYGTMIMNSLPKEKMGQGISNMDFFQEMGGPIALSILGPILASQYEPAYHAALPAAIKQNVPGSLLSIFNKPDLLLDPTALQRLAGQFAAFGQGTLDQVLTAVRIGIAQGIHTTFIISFCFLLVGFVVVLFMPNVEVKEVPEE